MFGLNARLKLYINGYDRRDKAIDFLENKKTYSHAKPEFYYAQLREHKFVKAYGSLALSEDDLLYIKRGSYVVGQKLANNTQILSHEEWQNCPIDEKKLYTRGILRVLGKTGRNMPNTKKHELFIPFPPQAENWKDFMILETAIERFYQLADERTNAEEKPPLPYEPLGTVRNKNPESLKNELAKKGLKNGEKALRLKEGDLVYFRPTLKDDQAVVAEIAFSSIWRGRVETVQGDGASVHSFFSAIDPELLPFHEGRNFISPAELLFGFVQKDEKKTTTDSGRTLAGRVQVSFGQLASGQSLPHYQERVLLKNLLSPNLNTYGKLITFLLPNCRESWVKDRLLRVLQGKSSLVAAGRYPKKINYFPKRTS